MKKTGLLLPFCRGIEGTSPFKVIVPIALEPLCIPFLFFDSFSVQNGLVWACHAVVHRPT